MVYLGKKSHPARLRLLATVFVIAVYVEFWSRWRFFKQENVPPFRLSCLRNFAEIILENGSRSWKNPGKTLEFYVMKRVGTLIKKLSTDFDRINFIATSLFDRLITLKLKMF